MNVLLRLKHWQLFLVLFVIPFVLEIIGIARVFITRNPAIVIELFPIILVLYMGLYFGWFYVLGTNLNKKLPESVKMNLTVFKLLLFFPLVYILCFCIFMVGMFHEVMNNVQPNPAIFAVIFPFHLFSMFCIFYCLYFNAKSLKAVELQRDVTFSDYAGEFFLIWFFPIGVWILQPRINKLFEKDSGAASEMGHEKQM